MHDGITGVMSDSLVATVFLSLAVVPAALHGTKTALGYTRWLVASVQVLPVAEIACYIRD